MGHHQQDSFSSQQAHGEQMEQHITTVQHVGFTDALIAQKPSPWTKTMFKLYFFLLVAFLNSCINGYDGSVMSGINAMTYYQSSVLQYVVAVIEKTIKAKLFTGTSKFRRLASRPGLCFQLIQLETLLDHSSVVHLQIGGAEDGACSLVHRLSFWGLAFRHLRPRFQCSLGGDSF